MKVPLQAENRNFLLNPFNWLTYIIRFTPGSNMIIPPYMKLQKNALKVISVSWLTRKKQQRKLKDIDAMIAEMEIMILNIDQEN
ncbi:MAG: hypothetical protein JWQ28_382 [Pedobacter sp.]|jgi:hypothetical protein|nr:hypothetical protein [Pedobacter sp.]